ncbi:HEAT repeat domain-containing protein [Methanocella sp. MCL-LM]|uniref:HEAT repeat domain-containing protein n=1 Tax=Methanocella sp. MCL-LM TaxID=3412035 RepID=UPI003C79248E
MGLVEDFASIGFCGSCLIVPLIIMILAITLFKPEVGVFYLKNVPQDKKRLYGAIIYTLLILVVLLIFSISMSITSDINNSIIINFLVSCIMASFFYFPVIGAYIAYRIIKGPSIEVMVASAASAGSPTINKLRYSPLKLVDHLTSQNINTRNQAAYLIKEQNEPVIGLILQVCNQKYNSYVRYLSNQPHAYNIYDNDILTGKIFETVTNSQSIPYLRNHRQRWIEALEGARLYLIVSSESRQTGLLELIRILANQNSIYFQIQGQYIVKLCGNEMVEPLLNHMKSPLPEVRLWAIILISVLEDVRSWEPIRNALNDESPMVRNAAADAMRQLKIPMDIGTKQVIKEIVKIPCKYCGTYIENTCTTCPSCGAPLGK